MSQHGQLGCQSDEAAKKKTKKELSSETSLKSLTFIEFLERYIEITEGQVHPIPPTSKKKKKKKKKKKISGAPWTLFLKKLCVFSQKIKQLKSAAPMNLKRTSVIFEIKLTDNFVPLPLLSNSEAKFKVNCIYVCVFGIIWYGERV